MNNPGYPIPMVKELKDLKPLIDKCVLCGGCHPDCPTYQLSRYEHDAARGKVLLAKALLEGDIPPSKSLGDKFDHCLGCMACTAACPAGADPAKVIVAARNEIRKKTGLGFLPKFIFSKILPRRRALPFLAFAMNIATWLFRVLPPVIPGAGGMVADGKKRPFPAFSLFGLKGLLPKIIPAKNGAPVMRVGYFTGCMADRAFGADGLAVIELLTLAGAEVVLIKDEVCCGAPSFFAGDMKSAEIMAMKNLALFSAERLDFVVTSCATCGSVLKESYPEMLDGGAVRAFAEKVVDFQQLLADKLLSALPKKGDDRERVKVTYHDPCHLSRGMKVIKEPRAVLRNLPGVEFVEMAEADRCCGGSGLFGVKHYADSLEIGRQKALNIRASGARIVATECPSCQMQLADMLARFAPEARVMHTAELALKSLRGETL